MLFVVSKLKWPLQLFCRSLTIKLPARPVKWRIFSDKFVYFKIPGSLTGTFNNSHQALQTGPTWVRQQFKLEVENQSGDIDQVFF